jgi:hypothetical protein
MNSYTNDLVHTVYSMRFRYDELISTHTNNGNHHILLSRRETGISKRTDVVKAYEVHTFDDQGKEVSKQAIDIPDEHIIKAGLFYPTHYVICQVHKSDHKKYQHVHYDYNNEAIKIIDIVIGLQEYDNWDRCDITLVGNDIFYLMICESDQNRLMIIDADGNVKVDTIIDNGHNKICVLSPTLVMIGNYLYNSADETVNHITE